MGWFKKSTDGAPQEVRPDPVVLDLGLQKEFEVEMHVGRLRSEGLDLHLLAQSENPRLGGLWPKHCRIFVAPDDAPRVRAELEAVGLL
jgi:hypothetical protein